MKKRILYDIKDNRRDYFDSLVIMENTLDNHYDFVYMEIPLFLPSTEHLFTVSNSFHSIDSEFLGKCLENAYRILKEDGILVFVAPKTVRSIQEFFIPLNQLFPCVMDMIYLHDSPQIKDMKYVYFCSKKNDYIFPPFGAMPTPSRYPHRDKYGSYRWIPLSVKELVRYTPRKICEWYGINYNGDITPEIFDNPKLKNRIRVQNSQKMLKIYRAEEFIPGSFVLKDESWTYPIAFQLREEIIAHIMFFFCKPGDNIFCPFDCSGIIPALGTLFNLSWISVRTVIQEEPGSYWNFPGADYEIRHELSRGGATTPYHEDILFSSFQIKNLQEELQEIKKPLLEPIPLEDGAHMLPSFNAVETGKRLRKARASLKVSKVIDEFAKAGISLSRQNIYAWEKGTYFPSPDHLVKLAAIYKVPSLDYLFVAPYREIESKENTAKKKKKKDKSK